MSRAIIMGSSHMAKPPSPPRNHSAALMAGIISSDAEYRGSLSQ